MNHQMCFQKFDIIAMYWLLKHISNGKRNGFTSTNVESGFGLVCLSLLLLFSSLQQQVQQQQQLVVGSTTTSPLIRRSTAAATAHTLPKKR